MEDWEDRKDLLKDVALYPFGIGPMEVGEDASGQLIYEKKIDPDVVGAQAFFATGGAALGAATGASIAALGATAYFFYLPRKIDAVLAKYMLNTTFKSLSPHAAMFCYAAYKRDFGMMRVALQHDDAQAFFNQPGALQAIADLAKLSVEKLQEKMII